MMYKHRNMWQCFTKQILLIYIVHLLDKYNKIENLMSFVCHGWETWSVTLRKESRLWVLKTRVLRTIYVPKGKK